MAAGDGSSLVLPGQRRATGQYAQAARKLSCLHPRTATGRRDTERTRAGIAQAEYRGSGQTPVRCRYETGIDRLLEQPGTAAALVSRAVHAAGHRPFAPLGV